MPSAPNRLIVVLVAAVVSGGIGAAIGVAFPGRAKAPVAAAPTADIVQTPQPVPTVAPTPSPLPSPEPVQRVVTTRRSAPAPVANPRPRSGGTGDISGLPGPAQKAISDQPGTPKQPSQPGQP